MNARVGFIVDNLLPGLSARAVRHTGIRSLWRGAASSSPMGVMRFGWVTAEVNRRPELGLIYELYRPFRRYDLLVFLKSFDPACGRLAAAQARHGGRTILEVNVDYFESDGVAHYDEMLPTPAQVANATAMARQVDGIIAASEAIRDTCAPLNANTAWIPDNVDMALVPPPVAQPSPGGPLPLLWCGQPVKLFELLAIAPTLRRLRERVRLVLITGPLDVLSRWPDSQRRDYEALLRDVPHEYVRFESIPRLLERYSRGGVAIAPRFLDSTYNRGHTEWRITLPMACGCLALCSPVPSYTRLAALSGGRGLRICETEADWEEALDAALAGNVDWAAEETAARRVVADHYSTRIVAARHAAFVRSVLASPAATRR